MSDILRITGMVSGMDTDSTVKKLIEAEQIKVDKAEQERQYTEWQKEDYREVANVLRGFQDEYFDVLNSATNMRSTSTFDMFSGTVSMDGEDSSAVSIKTSAKSVVGEITVNSVTKLATKDTYKSGSEVLGNIISDTLSSIGTINSVINSDNTMSFTFDGVTKEIELDQNDYADHAAYATDLTNKLRDAFTNVDITAEIVNTDQIEFKIYQNGTGDDVTPVVETGHRLEIESDNATLLVHSGLTAGQTNTVDTSGTVEDLFGVATDSSFTINDIDFAFTKDATISDIMSEINSSSAGVTISFDSFTDKFTLESNTVGSDSAITLSDADGLLSKFKLQGGDESYTAGGNAEFVVNGVSTTRSSNSFEINGSTITLNEIPTEAVTVDVTADTSDTKDLIVKFVDSYNKVISTITEMISTNRNYDYMPLSSEQKEAMTDDDIEAWQKEARKGTLSDDSSLDKITQSLRSSLYESVEGLGISLYDIGIQTSVNYREKGKLVIDENKLDKALSERPNEVIELFTKQSDTSYTDYENRLTRNSENGIAYRINDILQDNIRLTRDDNGNKGYLIDRAGLESGTDNTSYMAKKLQLMDSKIDDLLDMLAEQESKYYTQFARMESAMASMDAQSSWLASQFGG